MSWLFNDAELAGVGFIRLPDQHLADNTDGFFDECPDNHLRLYDCRTMALYDPTTHAVVSHGLLDRLLEALVYEAEHQDHKRAAA